MHCFELNRSSLHARFIRVQPQAHDYYLVKNNKLIHCFIKKKNKKKVTRTNQFSSEGPVSSISRLFFFPSCTVHRHFFSSRLNRYQGQNESSFTSHIYAPYILRWPRIAISIRTYPCSHTAWQYTTRWENALSSLPFFKCFVLEKFHT